MLKEYYYLKFLPRNITSVLLFIQIVILLHYSRQQLGVNSFSLLASPIGLLIFRINSNCPPNFRRNIVIRSNLHRVFESNKISKCGVSFVAMSMVAKHGFNPFATRNRNTNVKWYETELEPFYNFVQNQPLLSAEQELQYGKALQMWTQVEQMREKLQLRHNSTEKMSNEELANIISCSAVTLEKMSRYANFSKSRLLNSNLKLVLAIVSRYRSSSIPNSELIAEGTRGLAKAVLRFDHSKGFRFATYATWYVHQAVNEYVRWRRHPAKMPSRYLLLQRRVKQFATDFKATTGKQPSLDDVATALGQSRFDIMKVISMQLYPQLLGTAFKSQDNRNDRDRTMEDLLPSLYKAPLAQADHRDLRRDMEEMMLSNLNDVERDVLRLRLGLDDGRIKPVKEVGRRFKISWKQVRSVEKEALSKLMVSDEITDFVDSYHSV